MALLLIVVSVPGTPFSDISVTECCVPCDISRFVLINSSPVFTVPPVSPIGSLQI